METLNEMLVEIPARRGYKRRDSHRAPGVPPMRRASLVFCVMPLLAGAARAEEDPAIARLCYWRPTTPAWSQSRCHSGNSWWTGKRKQELTSDQRI